MKTVIDKPAITPPSALLWMTEGNRALSAAMGSVALWPILRRAPHGDGHAVLVLPGLTTSDDSTALLRGYLESRGYDVHGWGQGVNLGPRPGVEQGMEDLLEELVDWTGRRVSLVGWSLGGMYARELASLHPGEVRDVITLGSPFVGDPQATNARRVYEAVSGEAANDSDARWRLIGPTPPVPTTSIYSRTDGIVAWQTSIEKSGPKSESIEVVGSHLGLGFHPAVLYALADRLAQPEGRWKPFERSAWNAWMYPEPAVRK